ncbi:hypothetical protein P7C73_g295, partial [Tremellales sp. Uapishka_1]
MEAMWVDRPYEEKESGQKQAAGPSDRKINRNRHRDTPFKIGQNTLRKKKIDLEDEVVARQQLQDAALSSRKPSNRDNLRSQASGSQRPSFPAIPSDSFHDPRPPSRSQNRIDLKKSRRPLPTQPEHFDDLSSEEDDRTIARRKDKGKGKEVPSDDEPHFAITSSPPLRPKRPENSASRSTPHRTQGSSLARLSHTRSPPVPSDTDPPWVHASAERKSTSRPIPSNASIVDVSDDDNMLATSNHLERNSNRHSVSTSDRKRRASAPGSAHGSFGSHAKKTPEHSPVKSNGKREQLAGGKLSPIEFDDEDLESIHDFDEEIPPKQTERKTRKPMNPKPGIVKESSKDVGKVPPRVQMRVKGAADLSKPQSVASTSKSKAEPKSRSTASKSTPSLLPFPSQFPTGPTPTDPCCDLEKAYTTAFRLTSDFIKLTRKDLELRKHDEGDFICSNAESPFVKFQIDLSASGFIRAKFASLSNFPDTCPNQLTNVELYMSFKANSVEGLRFAEELGKRLQASTGRRPDVVDPPAVKSMLSLYPDVPAKVDSRTQANAQRRQRAAEARRAPQKEDAAAKKAKEKAVSIKSKKADPDPSQSRLALWVGASIKTVTSLLGLDSAKQTTRQSSRRTQGSNSKYRELDDSEEDPILLRAASPPAFVAPDDKHELLFTFPLVGRAEVNILKGDRYRVQGHEFLNDTLIEFGLKYILSEMSEETQNHVYLFNSFFYGKLSLKGKLKPTEERWPAYETVRKWTKGTDIFDKDYIIVPINENYHWYLAIIVNPKGILRRKVAIEPALPPPVSTNSPTASATDPPNDSPKPLGEGSIHLELREGGDNDLDELSSNSASSKAESASDAVVTTTKEDIPMTVEEDLSKLALDPSLQPPDPQTFTTPTLQVFGSQHQRHLQQLSASPSEEEEALEEIPVSKKKEPKPDAVIWGSEDTYVLTFDSLGSVHPSVSTCLNRWLAWEARDKRGIDYTPTDAIYRDARVPLQTNFSDCGVYLMHYVRTFLEDAESVLKFVQRQPPWTNMPERPAYEQQLSDIWRATKTGKLRESWMEVIDELSNRYKGKIAIPTLEGGLEEGDTQESDLVLQNEPDTNAHLPDPSFSYGEDVVDPSLCLHSNGADAPSMDLSLLDLKALLGKPILDSDMFDPQLEVARPGITQTESPPPGDLPLDDSPVEDSEADDPQLAQSRELERKARSRVSPARTTTSTTSQYTTTPSEASTALKPAGWREYPGGVPPPPVVENSPFELGHMLSRNNQRQPGSDHVPSSPVRVTNSAHHEHLLRADVEMGYAEAMEMSEVIHAVGSDVEAVEIEETVETVETRDPLYELDSVQHEVHRPAPMVVEVDPNSSDFDRPSAPGSRRRTRSPGRSRESPSSGDHPPTRSASSSPVLSPPIPTEATPRSPSLPPRSVPGSVNIKVYSRKSAAGGRKSGAAQKRPLSQSTESEPRKNSKKPRSSAAIGVGEGSSRTEPITIDDDSD